MEIYEKPQQNLPVRELRFEPGISKTQSYTYNYVLNR
jgi:hypothetical protein